MTKTPEVESAEAALLNLEKHKHAAAMSHRKARRSEKRMYEDSEDAALVAQHKSDMEKHDADKAASLQAHADSGVTDRQIDEAAQAVLDARGEAHTETNILPSGKSVETV